MTAPDFWIVVETADHGEPIIAMCRTEAEAQAWAQAYDADPRYFGDPVVRPHWFSRPYDPTDGVQG